VVKLKSVEPFLLSVSGGKKAVKVIWNGWKKMLVLFMKEEPEEL